MLQLLLALAAGAGSAGMSGWVAWTGGEVLASAPPLTHASSPHHAPLSPHPIRSLSVSERRLASRRLASRRLASRRLASRRSASRRLLPIKKLREALAPKDVDMLIHSLTHLDANGDGSVSKEEVLYWMAALDVDHDGKVSEEEMQFMVLAKGGSEESFTLIWRRLDVNGDGYVSLFEVAEVFGVDELLLQVFVFRPPTHFSHMSHPTFPISHSFICFFEFRPPTHFSHMSHPTFSHISPVILVFLSRPIRTACSCSAGTASSGGRWCARRCAADSPSPHSHDEDRTQSRPTPTFLVPSGFRETPPTRRPCGPTLTRLTRSSTL